MVLCFALQAFSHKACCVSMGTASASWQQWCDIRLQLPLQPAHDLNCILTIMPSFAEGRAK
eukprot:CAMPEP_0172751888 /NCGR_PEP_ID=MMETSP1074-20121228/152745_1 /TAXON_ID=2916 /ORGANISM="Ceratium fusus, Strain PA161109" /LENGTH=60 /DNA_ID=CAMNT_0013584315 /DNA_START=138 /DNA_END=320 /DNA_ORIENTATION=-